MGKKGNWKKRQGLCHGSDGSDGTDHAYSTGLQACEACNFVEHWPIAAHGRGFNASI